MENNINAPTMTAKEAAGMLNVEPHTVYRLVREKAIPYYKIGGRVKFAIEELKTWLQSCKVEQAEQMAA